MEIFIILLMYSQKYDTLITEFYVVCFAWKGTKNGIS